MCLFLIYRPVIALKIAFFIKDLIELLSIKGLKSLKTIVMIFIPFKTLCGHCIKLQNALNCFLLKYLLK